MTTSFFSDVPPSRYTYILSIISGWIAVLTAFFLPLSTSITDILFIINAALFFLSGSLVEKCIYIYQRRALFLSLVLFAWMLVGLFYSTVSLSEGLDTLSKYSKLLLGVFFVPIFKEEKWREWALRAFFFAVVVVLLAAVLKELGLGVGEKYGRFLVFKDRIQTSFLMAIAAYFSAIHFFENRASSELMTRPIQKSIQWIYAALFLISTFFLFSIDGRSGYVVFFVLLVWLLWERWRWKGGVLAICMSIILMAMAYCFSPAFNTRVQESVHDTHVYQTGENNTSLGLRAEFIKYSWVLIKAHPLLGTGTGSFKREYAKLQMPAHLITGNPHNQYIHIMVQWGVVGLALLLWLFGVQWRDSYVLSPTLRQIAQGMLLAIAVGSLANSWILDTMEGHFYVYYMALAFATQRQSKTIFFHRS